MSLNQIETGNLVLRQISLVDREDTYRQFSDEDVCRFLVDAEPFSCMREAEELIEWYTRPEPRAEHRWVIRRRADGDFLGTCGYHNWDRHNHSCELGYDLNRGHWGKGYMTEALRAVLTMMFEQMDVNRVQAFVHLQNERSINLLLKLGFQREGIVRDKHYFRGCYYDHYCFSLLRREWQP